MNITPLATVVFIVVAILAYQTADYIKNNFKQTVKESQCQNS